MQSISNVYFKSEMEKRRDAKLLFLMGLFYQTQVYLIGIVGISEIFVLLAAPFVFLKNIKLLKRDGFMPLLYLVLLTCIGGAISALFNGSPLSVTIKCETTAYSIFAATVILHSLLRGNIKSFRWFLLGLFLSGIIKVFAFHPGVHMIDDAGEYGLIEEVAIDETISHPLFWLGQFNGLTTTMVGGWYQYIPIPLIVIFIVFSIVFVGLTQTTGRSSAAVLLVSVTLLFIGGKTVKGFSRVKKHFGLIIIMIVLLAFFIKSTYSFFASNGYMGYDARQKYELQTRSGSGFLNFLMAGRGDFFVSLRAMIDRPIIGYGPEPQDTKGYYMDFLSKYGTHEDVEAVVKLQADRRFAKVLSMLPVHSYLLGFWEIYGLPGLILWLYVLFVTWKFMTRNITAIPYIFGYMCIMIPSFLWAVFFSPYSGRIKTIPMIVFMLFAQSEQKGRHISDPIDLGFEDYK